MSFHMSLIHNLALWDLGDTTNPLQSLLNQTIATQIHKIAQSMHYSYTKPCIPCCLLHLFNMESLVGGQSRSSFLPTFLPTGGLYFLNYFSSPWTTPSTPVGQSHARRSHDYKNCRDTKYVLILQNDVIHNVGILVLLVFFQYSDDVLGGLWLLVLIWGWTLRCGPVHRV